jgi:hypothetical protein
LPAAWLSQTANDNPNLDLCDAEVTHERVGPGSPWMLQSLWESGGPMGAISPPMEKWNQDHLVQDIRASNSNEPPGISLKSQAPLRTYSNNVQNSSSFYHDSRFYPNLGRAKT